MDTKVNMSAKKRRELLGITSKRKMSLRKNMDNMKMNDCTSDITQITKCVFLGSLCLKPVPQLFDNPSMLEELDQTVFHTNVKEYRENIEQSIAEKMQSECSKRVYKKRTTEVPKSKQRLMKAKTEPTTSIDIRSIKEEQNIKLELLEDTRDKTIPAERSPTLPPIVEEPIPFPALAEFTQTATPLEGSPVEPDSSQDLTELTVLKPDSETASLTTLQSVEIYEECDFEQKIMLKEEDTPELLLSDSDDETIDQLMFNIMDIKIEHAIYGKDFFDMPAAVIEQFPSEYSENTDTNSIDTNPPSNKSKKKYLKRNPQCKICSKVFSSYIDLKKHKSEHNGDKPYLCSKCGENHETLDQLLAHLRTHQGKRPYVCKKCHQSFKSMKALENHKPVHILRKVVPPKKLFNCEVCKKEFHKLCDLERHTRVHTGEKPSVCNICNRRFQQAHNLNKHLLIHTQEKPYQCDICNKKFGRNDVLSRHLLTHSVKKPNPCEICMKTFIRVSQLILHKKKYHSQTKELENDICL